MELHQNFAHYANARFGALALQRQRVEILHDLFHRALEFAVFHSARKLAFAFGHPVVEEVVRRVRLDLVRARAIECHHEQVAVAQCVNGLQQHLRRDIEPGVHLAKVFERQRDDGNVPEPRSLERLADERDVVRGAAAAAGLRDEHGELVGVVAPRGDGFHNLPRDQD